MDIYEALDELQKKAIHNEQIRQAFLQSRKKEHPLDEFCKVCQSLGYEIYPMDLINAGEDFYAAMKRSTNGGGENSPMLTGEDDFYEMFLSGIA